MKEKPYLGLGPEGGGRMICATVVGRLGERCLQSRHTVAQLGEALSELQTVLTDEPPSAGALWRSLYPKERTAMGERTASRKTEGEAIWQGPAYLVNRWWIVWTNQMVRITFGEQGGPEEPPMYRTAVGMTPSDARAFLELLSNVMASISDPQKRQIRKRSVMRLPAGQPNRWRPSKGRHPACQPGRSSS
jgi:hypothetical protein